ncbi:hypothetical protein [Fundidesulfovibrio magnetotacticus]|uniref:hypothetical protein n=1 Tax=Fundidesulfovibrio magnetotacticus TaxID=2730080 RepID=UPI0015633975|nr:hypothetical protein [Fundidesulfovibrio magnetotacticus]
MTAPVVGLGVIARNEASPQTSAAMLRQASDSVTGNEKKVQNCKNIVVPARGTPKTCIVSLSGTVPGRTAPAPGIVEDARRAHET